MLDVLNARWRLGCKLSVTVYAMVGDMPSDDDVFLFAVGRDDFEIAERIVADHNRCVAPVR